MTKKKLIRISKKKIGEVNIINQLTEGLSGLNPNVSKMETGEEEETKISEAEEEQSTFTEEELNDLAKEAERPDEDEDHATSRQDTYEFKQPYLPIRNQ